MYCLKCHHDDENCTCEMDLNRLKEQYEEGLGLLAKKVVSKKRCNPKRSGSVVNFRNIG